MEHFRLHGFCFCKGDFIPERNPMKARKLTAALAAVTLVSGVGAAFAAETGSTMSKSSKPSAMHSTTGPTLSLTTAQQRLAWKDIGRSSTAQNMPSDFTPYVGATIPTQITLKPVPAKLGRDVTALKHYDYALLKRELLIVNPTDKKVVDIINRHV
jgi:hypothetical protein